MGRPVLDGTGDEMSREIKFRGWDTRKKVMYSAEEMGKDQLTLSVDGRGFINVSGRSTKLSTFATHIIPMQYTGLKDKNGVEIHEGDIVHIGNCPMNSTVYWDDSLACFMTSPSHEHKGPRQLSASAWTEHNVCEIVGNIHQSPNLLENA